MRTFLISAATVIAAMAAASPAAAQYYPTQNNPYGQQQGYAQQGYGQPQGYGYGNQYQGQQGLVRSYMVRADQLRQRVDRMDGRDRINERMAARLRGAAIDLQNRTRSYARDGLNSSERRDLDNRLAMLEQGLRQAREGRGNGYGNGGYNQGNGYNNGQGYGQGGYGQDRDRDGQVDRNDPYVDANRDGIDDRTGYRIPR
jgi:opacity protein-like surface antigen